MLQTFSESLCEWSGAGVHFRELTKYSGKIRVTNIIDEYKREREKSRKERRKSKVRSLRYRNAYITVDG